MDLRYRKPFIGGVKGCKTIKLTLFAPNFTDFQEFWENMAISRLNPPFQGGSNGIQHAIFAINVKFIV